MATARKKTMRKKTVIIWDTLLEGGFIRFLVVDKDVSHLHNKYVNSTKVSKKHFDEINALTLDKKYNPVPMLDEFPYEEVKAGAKVIVCGFLP
jgi:hypothetical protein